MPRAIWSGAISFGLVNVPVKLSTAVRKQDVRFHQLHGADGARVEQRRFCSAEGVEVPYEQVVKGYEWTPGRHVVVTREELDALDPEATRTIDIEDFVDAAEVDPAYFEHAYWLLPDRQPATRPYALLREALRRSGKVGVGRFVMRSKDHLALVRPVGDGLMLSTLLFHDELVAPDELEGLPGREVEVADRELAMAEQLVESLSTAWEPERYRDHHRERVLELVARKASGEEIAAEPVVETPRAVTDLVSALEASLEEAERRQSA